MTTLAAIPYERPSKPILRYFGGKYRLADWIIKHIPAHEVYVELFGGGGSVLLSKPRSRSECYNDLDKEVVNLFEVMRDHRHELIYRLRFTPFARSEFDEAYKRYDDADNIERARMLLVRSWQGFASRGTFSNTGFRTGHRFQTRGAPPMDWRQMIEVSHQICDRMLGVCIENKDALGVIKQWDAAHTIFYIDPPYPMATRSYRKVYRHEMSDEQHTKLAAALHDIKGMALISGYPCELYDELYNDWHVVSRQAAADGGAQREEIIWMNNACRRGLVVPKQIQLL